MLKKGYIEGFYGRLMSLNDRTILLKKLSELSMDFYVYGPKEDPYHRSKWQPKRSVIKEIRPPCAVRRAPCADRRARRAPGAGRRRAATSITERGHIDDQAR